MHDHLKYPYFVAFYENRVKVGLKCVVPKSKIGTMQLPNIMYDYFLNHELGLEEPKAAVLSPRLLAIG